MLPIHNAGIFTATASAGNATGFTIDDVKRAVEKTRAFMAETRRLDVELFKAVLGSGIAIVPCDHLSGRNMILSVPESMRKLVTQAIRELRNPVVVDRDESEATP